LIFQKAHKQGKAFGIGESLEEPGGEQSGQVAATRLRNRFLLRMLAHLHHNASVAREFRLVKSIVVSVGWVGGWIPQRSS